MALNVTKLPESSFLKWDNPDTDTNHLICSLVGRALWCKETFNPFKTFPHLSKYKSPEHDARKISKLVSSLCLEDIIWVWQDGIIVRWEIDGVSNKIWKNEEGDRKLETEFTNHDMFNKGLYMWKKQWLIPDWIMIPDIHSSPSDTEWIFSMEHIEDACTLKSFELKQIYAEEIWQRVKNIYYSKEEIDSFLNSLTDYQLEIFLIEECWVTKDHIDILTSRWVDRLADLFPEKLEEFKKALSYLESIWLVHDDLHNSNIMVSNDAERLYIIDFWKVKIDIVRARNYFKDFYQ